MREFSHLYDVAVEDPFNSGNCTCALRAICRHLGNWRGGPKGNSVSANRNSASPNILQIVKLPIVTFLTKKDNKVVDSQFIREYSVVGVGQLEKLSGR